jgi:hypothetical protein
MGMRYREAVMRRMSVIVACVLSLVAGACGGSGRAHTADPPLKKASTTTTSTTISYAVPATIDVAYVDKVMKALDHVYGDAIRHLAQTKSMDVDFVKTLSAIYTPSESTAQQEGWSIQQQQPEGFDALRADGGDPITTASRLVRADPTCVVVAVDRNFGPAYKDPPQITPNRYVVLTPATGSTPPNPTPWRMAWDGFVKGGGEPSNHCV